jgi:hypothetical protein
MKNLLLIAFATLALCFGANVANACPDCEAKSTVKKEHKADKVEVKDADADKTADTNAATDTKATKTAKGCSDCSGSCKRASAGQLVKADRDSTGACGKAAGCGGGCGSGGGCGEGCGSGCEPAKADKPVKN